MKKDQEKPEVRVIVMRDGRIRIINGQEGAKYCGVKQQSFAACLRRLYAQRPKSRPTVSVVDRIRKFYPELMQG